MCVCGGGGGGGGGGGLNLLNKELFGGLPLAYDEDLPPTLENTIVVLWLKTIPPGLPQLVKQIYGPELRNKTVTLDSLKPEISLAMSSLLDELKSIEENRILCAAPPFPLGLVHHTPKGLLNLASYAKRSANRTGVAPHFLTK